MLTSPALRALHTTYPLAQIDFLVKSQFADLVKFNPNITTVLEMRTGDWSELQLVLNRIQSEKYDLIVDLHNSLRSRYIRLLAKATRTAVINKRVFARFMLVKFKVHWYGTPISVADRYLETCQQFGVQGDGKGLEVFVPDQTIETISSFMSKYKLERNKLVIGFAPAANHATKRWLPERYVELGCMLAKEYNARIVIFGGKSDETYCDDIAHMINMQTGAHTADTFAGKLSLIETAAVLDYCNVVVSNDTGLMHLAQARKKKVVAIFGSTVKEFGFFPQETMGTVVEASDVDCRPCSHIGRSECPKGHFDCMNLIQVDEVVKAVREFVG